ncbi:MAG: hypothetical protein OHK0045_24030 [Raineya sp.]
MSFSYLKLTPFLVLLLYCNAVWGQDEEFSKKLSQLSPKEQVYLYDEYAQKYKESKPKKSLEYATEGLKLAQKIKDTNNVAYFYTFIGVLYKNMGNYETALLFYQKAIPINQQLHNWQGNAGIYNNIAFVYRLQGKYKNALEYYLKALTLFEDSEYAKQKSIVLNNIGSLYFDQKQFKTALEYLRASLQIAEIIKDTLGIAFAYNNIGEVYQKQGNWQKAKSNFEQSLIWKKRKQHWRSIASGYANLGLVYQEEKMYDSAEFYLQEALHIYSNLNDTNGEVESLLRLGELWAFLQNQEKAIKNYQTALEKSLQIGAKPLTERAYKYLSEYFAHKQDFAEAYRLRLLYDNTKDSLMNIEQIRQINELQAFYNDQAKSKQIEILQKEKQIFTLEKESAKTQKGLLIATTGILALVISGLWWAYRLKRKNNKILSKKNEQIANSLLQKEILLKEIHHRVKNNLQIISSLLHLQAHKLQNTKDLLQQSQDRIQAMAIIHEKLYQSDNLQSISLSEYVENLLSYFDKTYALKEKNIHLQSNSEKIFLDIDKLIPCGLILNELIVNSIKYAFPEKKEGKICILASMEKNTCKLEIEDNGIGLPSDFEVKKFKSLGLRLVDGLVEQIKGSWESQNQGGAKFIIRFEPTLNLS